MVKLIFQGIDVKMDNNNSAQVFCVNWINISKIHRVKSVRIRTFSGPWFPVFGLITERYEVSQYSVRMHENTDQNNSKYGHFTRSEWLHLEKGYQEI